MPTLRTSVARPFTEPSFLLLIGVVILFILWRSSLLDVPFYWDEAWVYAPAVEAMTEHGPSLLPDAIPVDLSRGHPLLFHFTASLWASVLGVAPRSLHAFALLLATVLFFATYFVARSHTNGPLALVTAGLVLGHEGFLAQSGLLLPELYLALWMVLAVHAASREHWWAYALFASLALLTKESALALTAGGSVWGMLRSVNVPRGVGWRRAKPVLASSVPFLVLATFYGIQYQLHGWVFFPDHVDLIKLSFRDMAYKARIIYTALFEEQGRVLLNYAVTLVPLALVASISVGRRVLIALLFIAAIKALWGRWPIPFVPEPLSSLVILIALFFIFPYQVHRKQGAAFNWTVVSWPVFIAFWALSAMNFYTDRYLLPIFPIIAITGAVTLWRLNEQWPKWLSVGILGLCIVVQATHIGTDDKVGDTRMSYLDAIVCDLAVVRHCEEQGWYDRQITADEMQAYYMSDPQAGYLSDHRTFLVHGPIQPDRADLIIVTSVTPGATKTMLDSLGTRTLFRHAEGNAWSEVRERIPPDEQNAAIVAP